MKYWFLLAGMLLLLSCDPLRIIYMQNKTSEEAEFIIKIKEDSAKTSPFFISNTTKVIFNLKINKPYNLVKMSCGIGHWSKATIRDIVDDLESFQVRHAKDSILLSTEDQMAEYFLANRKGVTKEELNLSCNKHYKIKLIMYDTISLIDGSIVNLPANVVIKYMFCAI